jgi:hypothetical protein
MWIRDGGEEEFDVTRCRVFRQSAFPGKGFLWKKMLVGGYFVGKVGYPFPLTRTSADRE